MGQAKAPRTARRRPGRPKGDRETRERVLAAAVTELAAAGFYGTTVRSVADSVGITTASLLHHFPTKEALYGEVLARIAESLEAWPHAAEDGRDPEDRVLALVDGFLAWTAANELYSRVLMRELMDNVERASRARRWYLAPVVRHGIDAVRKAQSEGGLVPFDAETFVFQFVGSVVYFFIALPTAERIIEVRGADRAELVERFRAQLLLNTRAIVRRETGTSGEASS